MRLSIVTTMYYSAPYIEQFCAATSAEARKITPDYEIVVVNDGSPDHSLEIAIDLHRCDPHIRIIDLSRNFGQHRAIMAGLEQARGDLIFFLDCDLEIRPEILAEFHAEYERSGADVVYGVQTSRQDRITDRIVGESFYALFNALSEVKLPKNLTTARLMTRRYVQALISHREREVLIGGLWTITGFHQTPLHIAKASKGSTTYRFGRKISLLVNAVTSFSNKPLVYIFYLGALLIFLSGLAALLLVFETLRSGFLPGWPSLIVSVWMLGGITIFCLGIIGIYLSKIFIEVKQRPYTIIRHHYDRTTQHDDGFHQDSQQHRVILQHKD